MAKTQFSPEEQLRLFVERVQELMSTRLFRERYLDNYSYQIEWNEYSGSSFEVKELDEDDLRSFLLIFRHFISEKEPTFFYSVRISSYKYMKSNHEHELEQLEKAKVAWRDTLNSASDLSIFNLMFNGTHEPSAEHILDIYINGKYFHNDVPKRAELLKIAEDPIPLDKASLILALQNLTHILIWTGKFIGYGLKHDWFDFS